MLRRSERAEQNRADEQEDGADGDQIPFQRKAHGTPLAVSARRQASMRAGLAETESCACAAVSHAMQECRATRLSVLLKHGARLCTGWGQRRLLCSMAGKQAAFGRSLADLAAPCRN